MTTPPRPLRKAVHNLRWTIVGLAAVLATAASGQSALTPVNESGQIVLTIERSEGVVRLRALDPGRYPFMGEYHADTAMGVVVAE